MIAPLPWLPFGLCVSVTLGLYVWGRWVGRRHARARLFQVATYGVLLGPILILASAAWALHGLAEAAPSATASAATSYARSISSHFSAAAVSTGVGYLILLASIGVLVFGTLRRPRRSA